GVIHLHAIVQVHGDRFAVEHGDFARGQLGGEHLGRNHVIGEDVGELCLAEALERAFGQGGERLVGGREHGQFGLRVHERVHQVCRGGSAQECREAACEGGGLYEI